LILCLEVLNHSLLVSVDPASKDKQEELQVKTRLAFSRHDRFLPRPRCRNHARSIFCTIREVPVRQWVLSTPFEIRLLLARNAEAFGELTRIFMEEVLGQYRRRAAKLGIANCEGGALVFQHRFGGSLNLKNQS